MDFIKNTFFIIFNILMILIVFLYFEEDVSIEKIDPAVTVDFNAKEYAHRLPVYLATYADGYEVFFRNENWLIKSALNKGIDYFFAYKRSLIDPEFYEKHRTILSKKKGAGYWLWKPYFILKTLESMSENAVLIYADSGFHFKSSINPFLEKAKDHDVILIEYEPIPYGFVKSVATRETLKLMGCETEKCKNSPHMWGGFSIYRNTPFARKFVKEWLDYCTNETIIFGLTGDEPQDPAFKIHMDDETVLSVLNAKYSDRLYRYPKKELSNIIIWHHRHPDKLNIPVKFINYLRELRRFQRQLFNQKDS